jgi:cellobiose phosphorylase
MAADVYTNEQHAGRGGWTWYTGSAAWMYRLILESLLGLRLEVDRLHVTPLMPADWTSFEVHYRYRETAHRIHVRRVGDGRTVTRVLRNGIEQPERALLLGTDGSEHVFEVEIGGS